MGRKNRPVYPTGKVTPEWAAWAADNLADLPVEVFPSEKKAKNFRAEDGKKYRHAFTIVASPWRRFRINLYAGATVRDLANAKALVQAARAGAICPNVWSRQVNPDQGAYLFFSAGMPHKECDTELRPCTFDGCVADWHEWIGGDFNDTHRTESVQAEDYLVYGFHTEDGGEWQLYTDIDNDGEIDAVTTRRLINDLAWVVQDVDRLNARLAENRLGAAA